MRSADGKTKRKCLQAERRMENDDCREAIGSDDMRVEKHEEPWHPSIHAQTSIANMAG